MDAGAIVVTFGSTLDAFAFEDAARAAGLPGRLIPLPTGIAATCGLAWKLPSGSAAELLAAVEGPRHEGVYRFVDNAYFRLDA